MKKLLHVAVLGLLLTGVQAQAEDEKMMQQNKAAPQSTEKHKGAQQEKMKRCNAEAKGMKGDERKSKMSACLKG
jgi:hypothetical protein